MTLLLPNRDLTIHLPKPHPAQLQILREAKRWNILAMGRRWGKSTLGINRLVVPALEGKPVAWFAPAYPMLTEIWREVRNLLQPVTAERNEQEKRIGLHGGGIIRFWSLENIDSARGQKYHRVIVDEAAKIAKLEEAWNAVIRPTLADYEGDAWLLSTPRGRDFFWQAWTRGQDEAQSDWASWQMPSMTNPFVPASEFEEMRLALPERVYQQEILAEFLEEAGGVFRGVRQAIDAGRAQNEPPKPGMPYVLGVDLARIQDFTVLTVLERDTGRQVYFERFNQISWERQIARILAVAQEYRASVILDSTGVGDPVFEQVRKAGVPVTGFQITGSSKEPLIDNLALAIEQGQARLMDIPVQTNELLAYQYELTPSRNVRMNAPAGMHDDTVIALALAKWAKGARKRITAV